MPTELFPPPKTSEETLLLIDIIKNHKRENALQKRAQEDAEKLKNAREAEAYIKTIVPEGLHPFITFYHQYIGDYYTEYRFLCHIPNLTPIMITAERISGFDDLRPFFFDGLNGFYRLAHPYVDKETACIAYSVYGNYSHWYGPDGWLNVLAEASTNPNTYEDALQKLKEFAAQTKEVENPVPQTGLYDRLRDDIDCALEHSNNEYMQVIIAKALIDIAETLNADRLDRISGY